MRRGLIFISMQSESFYLQNKILVSSPEPPGSQGEIIVYPFSGVCNCGRQQFQKSSPLKPLGQSKPNFMWSLLGKGEQEFYINGPGHMTKMAAMYIYGKNL